MRKVEEWWQRLAPSPSASPGVQRRSPGCRPSPTDAGSSGNTIPNAPSLAKRPRMRSIMGWQSPIRCCHMKLAPRVAHRPVVDAETAFAMDMPDHVIVAEHRRPRKRCHQRADVATAIRNKTDLNASPIVAASGLRDHPCLALVIRREEQVASVRGSRSARATSPLPAPDRRNGHAERLVSSAPPDLAAGRRLQHDHLRPPRTIRPAAADEVRERD